MKQPLQSVKAIGSVILGLAGMLCGCTDNSARVITDPDPALKIPAMRAAADSGDFSQVKQLVKDLESDDPAVRFYSIGALEKLTGQTYGYQYFMDEEKRATAIDKWKAWLSGWEAGHRGSGNR